MAAEHYQALKILAGLSRGFGTTCYFQVDIIIISYTSGDDVDCGLGNRFGNAWHGISATPQSKNFNSSAKE